MTRHRGALSKCCFIASWWIAVSPAIAGDPAPENLIELAGVSRWQPFTTVSSGFGYKDNVMLASSNPIGSAFAKNSLEFLLWRLPEANTDFQGFISGDDVRYFHTPALANGPTINKEQNAIAQLELKQTINEQWRIGLSGQYGYNDQVVDSTVLLGAPSSVRARSQAVLLRAPLRYSLPRGYWLGLELVSSRVQYFSPTDQSYWEAGPKALVGLEYGNESAVTASYQLNFRQFDTQPEVDPLGAEIPGTQLAALQSLAQLEWRHHFDADRNWRLTSKFIFERNHATGSDFFSYRRYRLNEELRFRRGPLEITATGLLGLNDYDLQTSDSAGATRSSQQAGCGIRAQWKLSKYFKAFSNYEYDRILSNLKAEEYTANTFVAGLRAEF